MSAVLCSSWGTFQFTHPRGVRLASRGLPRTEGEVSIHAPARGATLISEPVFWCFAVSIHAPARGATSLRSGLYKRGKGFNSRTREGCDVATVPRSSLTWLFQFTHPRGVRPSVISRWSCGSWFQFTHPRGVRPLASQPPCAGTVFQFTHPRGVRHKEVADFGDLDVVSIHAPARGATDLQCRLSRGTRVSIHAPARGATPLLPDHRPELPRFNSRTREGCDCRDGEVAVELPLQTCFCEGTQIIPSIRCRKHLNSYNRMSMSACECLANS